MEEKIEITTKVIILENINIQRAGRVFQRLQRSKKGKGIENHAMYEDMSKRTRWTIFPNVVEYYSS